MIKSKIFFGATALAVILTACSNGTNENNDNDANDVLQETMEASVEQTSEDSTETTSTEEENPVAGGMLTMSMRIPKTLNPLMNEDSTVNDTLKLIFEPLFKLNSEQKVEPNLAESYVLSQDGLNLTINLKSGLTWQDGRSITGKDVVFSLDTIKAAPEGTFYKNALMNVTGYSAQGNTINIKYSAVYSPNMYNLCFPVIPEHYYKGNNAINSEVSLKPLGSGVYKFSSYQLSHEMILDKVGNFRGMPYIDKIKVLITSDRDTDLYAFEQSVTDVVKSSADEWGKYTPTKKTEMSEYYTNNFEFIGCNCKNQIFNNKNVRKAIAYAMPVDDIIETIYLGHAVKTNIPVNPNSYLYCKEGLTEYSYNLNEAKRLLAATGLSSEQLTFSILVNSENNNRVQIANILATRLNQIGMKVTVNKQSFENYTGLIKRDEFDIFIGGINLPNTPDLRNLLASTATGEYGLNYFNYNNPQVDALLNKYISAVGEENFKNSYWELQKFIADELPCIGICFKSSAVLTNYEVGGKKLPMPDNIFDNIEKWYIKN